MLIPYDNDVIPIPRELLRTFEDDEADVGPINITSANAPGTPSTGDTDPNLLEDDNIKPLPKLTDSAIGHVEEPFAGTRKTQSLPAQPKDAMVNSVTTPCSFKPYQCQRYLNSELNSMDVDLALKSDAYFNSFFYGNQRMLQRPADGKVQPVAPNGAKDDPLQDDPLKGNPLESIAKSLEPSVQLKVINRPAAAKLGSSLPIPETLLEDDNVLRFGEASCWDIEKCVPFEEDVAREDSDLGSENVEGEIPKVEFQWISHGGFNIDAAMANLSEFFRTQWKRKRNAAWRVNISLLDRKYKPGQVTTYIFETFWSIPTRKKPVATSSASIFFMMDVCDAKKKDAPAVVSCHYENSPMVFDPTKIYFGPDILLEIMDRKRILAGRLIN